MEVFGSAKDDRMGAKHVLKLSEEERGLLSEVAKGTRGEVVGCVWAV